MPAGTPVARDPELPSDPVPASLPFDRDRSGAARRPLRTPQVPLFFQETLVKSSRDSRLCPLEDLQSPFYSRRSHFFRESKTQLEAINGAVAKFTLNRAHQMVTAWYFAKSTLLGTS